MFQAGGNSEHTLTTALLTTLMRLRYENLRPRGQGWSVWTERLWRRDHFLCWDSQACFIIAWLAQRLITNAVNDGFELAHETWAEYDCTYGFLWCGRTATAVGEKKKWRKNEDQRKNLQNDLQKWQKCALLCDHITQRPDKSFPFRVISVFNYS